MHKGKQKNQLSGQPTTVTYVYLNIKRKILNLSKYMKKFLRGKKREKGFCFQYGSTLSTEPHS